MGLQSQSYVYMLVGSSIDQNNSKQAYQWHHNLLWNISQKSKVSPSSKYHDKWAYDEPSDKQLGDGISYDCLAINKESNVITATSILLSLNSTHLIQPWLGYPALHSLTLWCLAHPPQSLKVSSRPKANGDSKNWVPTIPNTLFTIIVCMVFIYVLCMIYNIK